MNAHYIDQHIQAIHVNIETGDLFEGIWPIPYGVSLNCYLVKGEQIALIDLVRDWEGAPESLEKQLSAGGISLADVNYLILNHLEPDHTGWIRQFRELNPRATIIATKKGIDLVNGFFRISEGVRAVSTGDTLDLGKGVVLEFHETPNVHWPETMITFEKSSRTAFSCDNFGGFGALGSRIFDDEYSTDEHAQFEKESLRYYANVLASFPNAVLKSIDKIKALAPRVVAPSHGIVWRKSPEAIVARYERYARWSEGTRPKHVCTIWGSMYGNTELGMRAVLEGLDEEGMPYTIHQVPNDNASFILADALASEGLLLAMPTYEYRMFPPMRYILDLMERKHIVGRTALRIGSWGWIGGAKKEYDEMAAHLRLTGPENVEWAGVPDDAVKQKLLKAGKEFAQLIMAAK